MSSRSHAHQLAFFWVLYRPTPLLGGWNLDQLYVFAGGVFAFIVSFDQFPVSLFLVVPKGETLPVVLFNYMKFDLDGAIAAASMVSILLALSVVVKLDASLEVA